MKKQQRDNALNIYLVIQFRTKEKPYMNFPDMNFEVPPDEDSPLQKGESVLIYTADTETDPFLYDRYPHTFCCGFYDGETYRGFWGPDCIDEMFSYIATMPPGIIYIHNGGRFDIYYMTKHIIGYPALIINGRIVQTRCKSNDPKRPHEIRDSYAIMPFALAKYKKDEIDYKLLEKDVRHKHKKEIMKYLKGDCVYLWDLCRAFVNMFGPKLTVGSTAMTELKKFHTFENLGRKADEDIRSNFYYGGRVECFKRGLLNGRWKVYDVNSMYPSVMRNYLHPVDTPEAETQKVRKSTCFIVAEGKNYGAFPTRTKEGLRFDREEGTFAVSIHEWETAIRHNLFEPKRIRKCINFRNRSTFSEFVDSFYQRRNQAKSEGDSIHALFYKYVLNSAYGKFAQNTAKYFEYTITDGKVNLEPSGWLAHSIESIGDGAERTFIVWKRKPQQRNKQSGLMEPKRERMYNVATGASITGASRAVLMDAIAQATDPIYCDTDSLICKKLTGVKIDENELGAWKLEATATQAYIAGKKLYALFNKQEVVKQANKGVKLSAEQIREVCKGAVIETKRDAPSFHLDGTHDFIKRKVRML
jgi:DNA polymerase elongation subunit (family B)